ncbi:MAG: CDP-alcohol phosphatidyltransferase family protein [Angustibacter sp.]
MTRHPERALRGSSAGAAAVLVDRGDDALLRRAVRTLDECGVDGPRTVLCAPGRRDAVVDLLPGSAAVVAAEARTALTALADVAEQHAASGRPLVLFDTGLVVSPVAALDLLDHAGRRTAAWVGDGTAPGPVQPAVRRGLSRISLVESVATSHHDVSEPTGTALGLLRVQGDDLAAAAQRWRGPGDWAQAPLGETLALALVALVRGGVRVDAAPLSGWPVAAASGPDDAPAALAAAAGRDDDWRTRLGEAKRPVDGFYSVFVVRHVSRWVTWRLLPTGVAPNTVTVVSFAVGILAALACAVGGWAWLVVGAVLLQVSLVLDCVDGEIARYTRRFSPLGAWLDVTGDRIKEYGIFAGLALSSARAGHDIWWLALLALALVAYRHFVDYGHGVTVRTSHRPRVSEAPLTERGDGLPGAQAAQAGGLAGMIARTDSTSARAWVHWAKKAVHLPIGERYLVISLTLLAGRPALPLATLVVLEVLSVLYTSGGRVLRSVADG